MMWKYFPEIVELDAQWVGVASKNKKKKKKNSNTIQHQKKKKKKKKNRNQHVLLFPELGILISTFSRHPTSDILLLLQATNFFFLRW